MIASERRKYILNALNMNGVIAIKDAARELGVAEMTIRRDFEKLIKEGKLKPIRGGAVIPEELGGAELSSSQKLSIQTKEKTDIAIYAASLVEDGSCVFLDGGTTLLPMIDILLRRPVKIITHNMYIFKRPVKPEAELVVLGGRFNGKDNINVGPFTVEMLEKLYFDAAFIGCAGIDLKENIVYSTDVDSLTVKQKAMEKASRRFLLADSTKFSKRGFLKLCELDSFDSVITNDFDHDFPLPENVVLL